MRAPTVFTISPAQPFLETFVAALLRGDVIPGYAPKDDPLELASATIYVPTQRAARALADTFLHQLGGASALLPRILPLGALESTETPLLFADPEPAIAGLPLPPAASAIWRRLKLATLIQAWAKAIHGALRSVDKHGTADTDDSEAFRVATSTVDAFHLAGDLAALIDEMQIEDVQWEDLDAQALPEFDDYWRITTTFLSIAVERWPGILEKHGLIDPAARQIALVEAQAAVLATGAQRGPVIAIGSTGTNKATARLLAAIARAPRGAVVLPGLDRDLDDDAWTIIGGTLRDDQEPSFGHPQAAMARLLPTLGVLRADVQPLGVATRDAEVRAKFVAEAMRPADTTDRWPAYRAGVSRENLVAALAGVSLIEAADEREEALCLAIAMREILETPGRTGALVTPDRDLARRVRGELLRWGVEVTDTGGEPLAARPLGILARLAVAAAANGLAARDVTALLAHPLTRFGRARDEVARLASVLEIGVLRAVALREKSSEQIFADAREAAADHHAHPAQKTITEEEWTALAALWRDLDDALAPLRKLEREQPLDLWVAAHRAALTAILGEDTADEDANALDTLFTELTSSPDTPLLFNADSYSVFFGNLAGEVTLQNTRHPHPRLQILGLLEARLIRADVMLLGGLDETVWPPQARTDPFLNRPMRKALGLTPPERRLGQTAHDFAQAMGGDTVILSRAAKRGGSPCVPSRFLLRLEALGPEAWLACKRRGARYADLARALDRPASAPAPIARPQPKPPLALRPTRLSVTQIETLRRDSYAIYAAKVLELSPLPQVGEEVDPSELGSVMHDTLRDFVLHYPAAADLDARRVFLRDLLRRAFGIALDDPFFAAFRWPALLKALDVFLDFDTEQRATLDEAKVELSGTLEITLADASTFALSGRADRIDRHHDGSATIIDYKTGQPPGLNEVKVGFAPQLTLEAAMLKRGAFRLAQNGPVKALYLKLGGRDGGFSRDLTWKGESFDDIVEQHFEGLVALLSSFRLEETGYPARPYPKFARDGGDYDHLARVREWALAGGEDPA
ncbi:double-strand break repair protein AddB [Beijerinckia sp. L45]|uniref:double-strand break repair protein AddB n=1 Tax=Beijerinckia sp. L45 TaxID=1641855 RepID=UPI00131A89D4|nr:double-strand break repair protein AddB [Beijerinckia sp. L45]